MDMMLPLDTAPLVEGARTLALIPGTVWTAKLLGFAIVAAIGALFAR